MRSLLTTLLLRLSARGWRRVSAEAETVTGAYRVTDAGLVPMTEADYDYQMECSRA